MPRSYTLLTRGPPKNLEIKESTQQGNRLYVSGNNVLNSKNVYRLVQLNRVVPIVPDGVGRFYIDTTTIPSGSYTLEVVYDYNGKRISSTLDVMIGLISGTTPSVGSPPVTTIVSVPPVTLGGTTNPDNRYTPWTPNNSDWITFTEFSKMVSLTLVGNTLNILVTTRINDTFIQDAITLNLKIVDSTLDENVEGSLLYINSPKNYQYYSSYRGTVIYATNSTLPTIINYSYTLTNNRKYSVSFLILKNNVGSNVYIYYYDIGVIILKSLKVQEKNLLFTVLTPGCRFFLDNKTQEIFPTVQGDDYTFSMGSRTSKSYTLIITYSTYPEVNQVFSYSQPSFTITNFAQSGPKISWIVNPITNASYFLGASDITPQVSNYSFFMGDYLGNNYTLSVIHPNYLTGTKSFTYVVPTFKMSNVTQQGNLIQWNASNALDASRILVYANVSRDITSGVLNPSTDTFTYAMTLDAGTYSLYLSQAGYATDFKAFAYTMPYFKLRNFSQRGPALSWTVSNPGNYTLIDPYDLAYNINNYVSGSTFNMIYQPTDIISGVSQGTGVYGTYTLKIGNSVTASESVTFVYTPPSLEVPVQQGDLISWRDDSTDNASYFLTLNNRTDITNSITYDMPLTYQMGRLSSGTYSLILSTPDYPEVSQSFVYTTRIILDKVIQKGNQLNLVGNGFLPNMSFLVDEYMIPSSLDTRVTSIQFDNNFDMIRTDGNRPTTFTGTFTGAWTFNLSGTNASLLVNDVVQGVVSNSKISLSYTASATSTLTIRWYGNSPTNHLFFSFIPPGGTETANLNYFKTGNASGLQYTSTFNSTQDYTQQLKLFYFGNSSKVNGTTLTKLSYAYQQDRLLTLVGTGLTGLIPTPGLTLLTPSDTQPTFTGYRTGPVNVSTFGYSTDTVPVVTVNTTWANPEMVTVRGAPSFVPDTYGVATQFNLSQDRRAYVFFGYFKPTVASNTFAGNVNDLVDLRIGTTTIQDLRSNGTSSKIVANWDGTITNNSTKAYTSTFPFIVGNYYPFLLTYINRDGNASLTCKVGTADLFTYCTLDKSTPGLYYYTLNESQLNKYNPLTTLIANYNTSSLFSNQWGYGAADRQTYWTGNTSYLVGNTYIPASRLNLSTIRYQSGLLTLRGTGFHANVSMFVNQQPVLSTYDGDLNASISTPFSTIYLMDGPLKSNVYTTFNVSYISKTLAVRNSSVNVCGSNFSNISYILIGNASANFSVISTALIQVKIPESTQIDVDFSIYDNLGGSIKVTTFTIPPPFMLTGYTPSRVWPGPLQIQGTYLYDLSYVTIGAITSSVVNLSYTSSTLNVSFPSYGKYTVRAYDLYGYTTSIPVTVTGLKYAFQVDDQLTLVGNGLLGLTPGLPLVYSSDNAPVFRGRINGSVNVSDGYVSNTVQVLPVTVTGSPGVVSVRGLPGPDQYRLLSFVNTSIRDDQSFVGTEAGYNTSKTFFTLQVTKETLVLTRSTNTSLSTWIRIYNRNGQYYEHYVRWSTITSDIISITIPFVNVLPGTNNYVLYLLVKNQGYQITPFTYTPPATNFTKPTITTNQIQGGLTTGTYLSMTLIDGSLTIKKTTPTLSFSDTYIYVYNLNNDRFMIVGYGQDYFTNVPTFTYIFSNLTNLLAGTHRYMVFFKGGTYCQTEYFIYTKSPLLETSPDIYATVYTGSFTPTAGSYTVTVNASPFASIQIGDPPLINTSTSASYTFQTGSYPLRMTYINLSTPNAYFSPTIASNGVDYHLLSYAPLIYTYNVSKDKLYSLMETSDPGLLYDRITRLQMFGYGDTTLQTYWTNASRIALVEAPVQVTQLNISTVRIENQILTLQGTGIHSNVSVLLDGVSRPFVLGNVNLFTNFSRIQLTDGLVQSNVYSIFNLSINQTAALRNSSVTVYGINLSTVSSIKIGTANASFVLFSDRIQVKIPESTQFQQPFTVYDPQGSSVVVTTFTIPPPFSITGFNASTLIQNASLTITGANFSQIAYVLLGTQPQSTIVYTADTIQLRVPVTGNVSVTIVDAFNNRASVDGLNVSNKFSVSSISRVRAFPGYPVTIFGEDFYDIALQYGDKSLLFSKTLSTITFSTPTGRGSLVLRDPHSNNMSLNFTVINLSYAFQTIDQVTLVGEGLTGLNPGLPTSFVSDKAPMFTGTLSYANVSLEGYVSDTVPVLSVTVTQSNVSLNPDLVTVRGLPVPKVPYRCFIVS